MIRLFIPNYFIDRCSDFFQELFFDAYFPIEFYSHLFNLAAKLLSDLFIIHAVMFMTQFDKILQVFNPCLEFSRFRPGPLMSFYISHLGLITRRYLSFVIALTERRPHRGQQGSSLHFSIYCLVAFWILKA